MNCNIDDQQEEEYCRKFSDEYWANRKRIGLIDKIKSADLAKVPTDTLREVAKMLGVDGE